MFEKFSLALFGAMVGWFLSWHRYRVAENANLISDHILDMERFADALRTHWATSYKAISADTQKSDIATIKAMHVSISSFYGEAEARLGTSRYREYQVLQLRLFKVGLGGDFESICRNVDEGAAIETQVIAWEIIQSLRAARRDQFGLRSALYSTWKRFSGPSKQYR